MKALAEFLNIDKTTGCFTCVVHEIVDLAFSFITVIIIIIIIIIIVVVDNKPLH